MSVDLCAAEIDLDAFRHNLNRVRQLAPQCRLMAVVKANAYGHELGLLLAVLSDADALAVARVPEALAVRECGYAGPVVVLEGVLDSAELALAATQRLQLVIHDQSQLTLLEQHRGVAVQVWLKLDSGMHRLGFTPDVFGAAWRRLSECTGVQQPPRLMTHLACADEPDNPMTVQQLDIFETATSDVNAGAQSVANSAGLLEWPRSHTGWVRPGLMLYGISPFTGMTGADHDLKPVMRLHSRLIATRTVRRNDTVGYASTWRAPGDTRIGTAAVGYGDGYPGNMPSGTPVIVNGRRAALAGRVSMDMITIDLGPDSDDQVGDEVVVWGPELPVEVIAAHCGRLSYELVCGVSPRVPRIAISS